VLESVQDMLLNLALQIAHDDCQDRRERQRQGVELAKVAGRYQGRKTDTTTHERIIALTHSRQEHRRDGEAGCMQYEPGEAGVGGARTRGGTVKGNERGPNVLMTTVKW